MAGEIMLRSEHVAVVARRDEQFADRAKELECRRRDAYLLGGIIGGFIGAIIGILLTAVVLAVLLERV